MNFSTFKTRLKLIADNMQTGDPFETYTGDYVNQGVKTLIMRASSKYPNFQLFPEHKDVEWYDVTIVDQNYLALPSDNIAVQRAFSLDSSSAPNLNNSDWRELSYVEPRVFDLLEKPTTQSAYPSQYTLREGRIYVHPTPRTSYTTYLKVDGLQDEPDMSANGDSPRTHSRWHPAILNFAAYHLLTDMGLYEQAEKQKQAGDEQILAIGGPMVALRRANVTRTIGVAGTPRRVM